MAKKSVTANTVIERLKAGPFPEPAHAWLTEVRNRTGWARTERYADALVVSCWPSRGIWFAGVEVKVSRQDWLKEVRDPEKSAAIQMWCNYWWLAVPVGVVELCEVPETWGLIEIDGKRCKTIKDAPTLEPAQPDRAFVASILRNQAKTSDAIRERGHEAGFAAAKARWAPDDAADVDAKAHRDSEMLNAQRRATHAERELEGLRAGIAEFEKLSGVALSNLNKYRARNIGPVVAAAQAMADHHADNLAQRLEEAAQALRALAPPEHGEQLRLTQAAHTGNVGTGGER